LPDSSREVLVCIVDERGRIRWIALTTYSFKHDAFNANDWEDSAEHAIDIDYWAKKPRQLLPKDVSSNGN